MTQPAWIAWTDAQWLDYVDNYLAQSWGHDSWNTFSDAKKNQAIHTARTWLQPWIENPMYPQAVSEQAFYLTTSDANNAINDYSSVSVSTTTVSVSYGRSTSTGNRPAWMSPIAWALLQQDDAATKGKWTLGRIV